MRTNITPFDVADKIKVKERIRKCSTVQENGCVEWNNTILSNGYGQTTVPWYKTGRGVHRIVLELELNRMLESHEVVCHKCNNTKCINPEHLYIGTNQTNADDKVAAKRQAKGSQISCLTEEVVREILKKQHRAEVYAVKYDITASTVYNIWSGKTWGHLKP